MSIRTKDIIISVLVIFALVQILVVKNILPAVCFVSLKTEEFWYDVSLAFFTGALVYAFTGGWSNLIIKKERKKIIINELGGFLSYSLERLESIEGIDFSKDKNLVKDQFKKLTYGSKAKSNASNSNTIFGILEKINSKKERLYQSCIPLIQNSNDTKLLAKVYRLFNNEIFSSKNEYRNKDFETIQNSEIGIGGYFYKFYFEVIKLKSEIKQ